MNRHDRRAAQASGIDAGVAEVRFGGRTVKITVLVNTDETVEEVVARVQTAAKGPKLRMVLVAGGDGTGPESAALWERLLPIVKDQARKGGVA